ncbi:MAG: DUF5610 domain-containing protein [Candidatus Lindowbacteria bacterium]|nr:DUF5610 domain-containing protein [Candidatus Lindowbacteria bacterium]
MTAISFDFSYSQTIESQRVLRAYSGSADSKEQEGAFNPALSAVSDGKEGAAITDFLNLGQSQSGLVGPETILAILEEKTTEKIEISLEGVIESDGATLEENYWSPENTARRIVDFATDFYSAYTQAFGEEGEAALDEFLSLVNDAVDDGFAQAGEIISEFHNGKVPEESRSTSEKTRELISQYLEDFRESMISQMNDNASSSIALGSDINVSEGFNEILVA